MVGARWKSGSWTSSHPPGLTAAAIRVSTAGAYSAIWCSRARQVTRSYAFSGGSPVRTSSWRTVRFWAGTRSRSTVLMSAAVTLPEGPTAAQSHSVMLPLPPPSSRHRQPWPTPSPARYRRVQGSRILDIRSSRWYSSVAASSRMYGRIGLTASRKPARRPSVADSRQHALPGGPFGPGVPGPGPLSPGVDPGHPGGEPGKDAEEPMMRVLVTAATKYGATAEIAQMMPRCWPTAGWSPRCSRPSRSRGSTATTRWCWAAPCTPGTGGSRPGSW